MRIIFMGTPDFAVPSLKILAANGFKPIAVVTGPDKRRGRGQQMSVTPIKAAAIELGISNILQPESVKSDEFAEEIQALRPDVIVVVAFKILPPAVFDAATKGSFNLHGSVLPRYRGAAPIHHAVMNGDTSTGVTTFFLRSKVDTGDIILTRTMPIGENDTTGDVHDRMMYLGAEAVLETIRKIDAGDVQTFGQNDDLASPAPKVFRNQGRIHWDNSAKEVHNHIRGYSPVPGAWTIFENKNLKILRSRIAREEDLGDPAPGYAVRSEQGRFLIGCGDGAVEVLELQLEGRKRMSAEAFLNGIDLSRGIHFTSAARSD